MLDTSVTHLVRVVAEPLERGDAVETRAGAERGRRLAQRGEHGEAASRAALDRNALGVGEAVLDDSFGAGDRILHIDDAPVGVSAVVTESAHQLPTRRSRYARPRPVEPP